MIANNFIYRSGTQHGDVAIGVWNSPNTEVAYNTVILNGDYVNAVEYRFATTTGVKILYNLTDAAIAQRDGASGHGDGQRDQRQVVLVRQREHGQPEPDGGGDGGHRPRPGPVRGQHGLRRPATAEHSAPDVGADAIRHGRRLPASDGDRRDTGQRRDQCHHRRPAITVTFSGAVDPTTVNTNTVQLLDPSNTAVRRTVSFKFHRTWRR